MDDPAAPSPASPTVAPAVAAWRRYDADEQRLTAHVSERMLDLAGLKPGYRVLDIATGRGEPALRAAARVAPGGVVVGTDPSDAMLDFARTRATAEGTTNVTLVVTGAETLDGVPEQAFDAALCRWGVMFCDRPRDALAAARRCLKPGGVLVAALWSEPAEVPWWSLPHDVLARQVPLSPIDRQAPGPFRYAASEVFRADLMDTGWSFAHEETLHTPLMEATTPEGVVAWCLAFGLPPALADQPPPVRAAWQRDLVAEAGRYRDADGLYRLGGATRLVVARAT